jgi:hypothetical protein
MKLGLEHCICIWMDIMAFGIGFNNGDRKIDLLVTSRLRGHVQRLSESAYRFSSSVPHDKRQSLSSFHSTPAAENEK